jgi:hypothetical protein
MPMNPKEKAVLERIRLIEDEITKGREYLESGKHADWHGFRSWFVKKVRKDKELPPHRDWVRKVFIPSRERALRRAEKILDKLS